jgi:DeoR/GlpR family transcriptional regulator of sugar metabolism
MLKEERQQHILSVLEDDGHVDVEALSQRFDVSEVTIRRDLRDLAGRGLVRRAYGGAVMATPEPPVVQRMAQVQRCKECIGRAAAALVGDGESIFIGSGSTTAYVARNLASRSDLTVVTNALNIADELALSDSITVVVAGGVMRHSELSLVGHIAEQALGEVRVDKTIVGMRAVSLEAGMTNDYLPEVMTDRAIIQMAPELIVVVDHTKLGKVSTAYIAPVKRVTTLVTDCEADGRFLDGLRQLGVRVIVADG